MARRPRDPKAIAAALGARWEDALLWLPGDGSETPRAAYWLHSNSIKAMEKIGLTQSRHAERTGQPVSLRWRLTPLGIRVWRVLHEQRREFASHD